MAKAIFLMKRIPGITKDQFRTHYETVHIPLALKYIGHLLVDYKRNYPIMAVLDPANPAEGNYDCGYDCITEMWVEKDEDLAEMARIFASPEISPLLREDEARFLDSKAAVMILSDEVSTDLSAWKKL